LASTYPGRCGGNWIAKDTETGFSAWKQRLTQCSIFVGVAASMAEGTATIAEMAQTGRQALDHCCKVHNVASFHFQH
jgi:hypothetical protein